MPHPFEVLAAIYSLFGMKYSFSSLAKLAFKSLGQEKIAFSIATRICVHQRDLFMRARGKKCFRVVIANVKI